VAAPARDEIPDVVGRYEVVAPLAEGGMGQIVLAHATGAGGFRKRVVLKRLRPELASEAAYVRMLLDEARTLATLDHPNIVQVVDVVLHEGAVYLVMEYLSGWDGRRVITRAKKSASGPGVPVEAALAIAMGACAALDYAHKKTGDDGAPLGIVHRDISPANLFCTGDGGVKVIDFGIARSTIKEHQTETGMVRGKLPYMSPEQCRGTPVDARSDVFSLGVTLYELLTGSLPHRGTDDFDLRKAIVERPPPPISTIRPCLAPSIEAVLLSALEKDPSRRPQTAASLAAALHAAARGESLDLSPFALAGHLADLFGVGTPRPAPPPSAVRVATPAATRAVTAEVVADEALPARPLPRRSTLWIGGAAAVTVGAVAGYAIHAIARVPPAAESEPTSRSTATMTIPSASTGPSVGETGAGTTSPSSPALDARAATSSSSSSAPSPQGAPRTAPAAGHRRGEPIDPDAPLPR
jgi:serine/threonine protein kinase